MKTLSLAAMILCTISVAGFSQSVKEKLPNGTVIFTLEGKDYLGLPSDKAAELNAKLDRLDQLERALPVAQAEINQLKQSLVLAMKGAELSDTRANLERERAAKFEVMYNSENAMRLKAEGFLKRGAVARFLENPATDLLFKLTPVVIAAFK
jgi:hypothetical protein